jgi:1-acyl-sn-glycerol-3-phosphate acyltransferase
MIQRTNPRSPARRLLAARRSPAPRDVFRSLYIHSTLLLALTMFMLLVAPLLLIAGCTFDRRKTLARRAVRALFPRLIRHYCRLCKCPLHLETVGIDFRSLGPCIVVANHCSCMDVLLLMMLPLPAGAGRVWAKDWPFKVPLLGALMRLSGHLFVNDFNLLPDARDCLADGSSLIVFPESSRSRTGDVGRFREGAFLLAARTGRPVVPVAIHGTFDCMPPGQPWIYRPSLKVEVLGVLRTIPGDPKAHTALRRQAQTLIADALDARHHQAPPAAPSAPAPPAHAAA